MGEVYQVEVLNEGLDPIPFEPKWSGCLKRREDMYICFHPKDNCWVLEHPGSKR